MGVYGTFENRWEKVVVGLGVPGSRCRYKTVVKSIARRSALTKCEGVLVFINSPQPSISPASAGNTYTKAAIVLMTGVFEYQRWGFASVLLGRTK